MTLSLSTARRSPIKGIDDIAGKRIAALEGEKWFGPRSDAPYPMTPEIKEYLLAQLKK